MSTPSRPGHATQNSRVIRVFISSTFRDMMRERDLLVKEVFPALRRRCAARFVTFTEVDLRWGITEAQADEGQVLPLCLAEIERSRPYFIGLLGERYGWIPDGIRPDVLDREPWLRTHVQGRTSVTELEILHGVLNDPAMRDLAFFYFRDPAYASDAPLAPGESRDMVERNIAADVGAYGEAEATRRTAERKTKLAALKQRIRDSGLPVFENYPNPEALAKAVHEQFDAVIDRLYPAPEVPDARTQERLAHEAYAAQKLFACINRPAHMAALNAFAEPAVHDGRGLVVTGESGGGKTALLAAWVRDWAASHPEDFLFQHYFGATPDSASPDGSVRRLLGELKNHFAIAEDIPADPDKFREVLPLWLAQTMGRGRVVLVLDGLNQIHGNEPERRLRFLPEHVPPHVSVLASALPGPALDALRERGWAEHELPPATAWEVDAMVDAYLTTYARALEPDLRQALVLAPGARNPLFLRTVLEELRQCGSFERLPDRVRYYLGAPTSRDLFLRVLARWQDDFDGTDRDHGGLTIDLVRRALSALWAARQGLSEPEWLDLLGIRGDPLPRAFWTPLFLALEPHLTQRAGLFAFGHDFLRQAVDTAFLSSDDGRKAAHLAVADYFERHPQQREMSPRKADELPWQYAEAQSWEALHRLLTDLTSLPALMARGELGILAFWLRLPSSYSLKDSYERAWDAWAAAHPEDELLASVAHAIGFLLETSGEHETAVAYFRRAMNARVRQLGDEHPSSLSSAHKLAQMLASSYAYAEADALYRSVLARRERVLGPDHPDTLMTVNNLGHLQVQRGEFDAATPLYQRALDAHMRTAGARHPDTLLSMHNMASLLQRQGRLAEARTLYESVLAQRVAVLGASHPSTVRTMNNLGNLLDRRGDHAGALAILRTAYDTMSRVLGPHHYSTMVCAINTATAFCGLGDFAEAASWYRIALTGCEAKLGATDPTTKRCQLALLQAEINAAEAAGQRRSGAMSRFARFLRRFFHR